MSLDIELADLDTDVFLFFLFFLSHAAVMTCVQAAVSATENIKIVFTAHWREITLWRLLPLLDDVSTLVANTETGSWDMKAVRRTLPHGPDFVLLRNKHH